MNIDRERFLKILEQFEGDTGYLIAIFDKVLSLLPTGYIDAYIEKYFYDFVWSDTYYIVRNKFSSEEYRFPSLQLLEEHLVTRLGLTPNQARKLVLGHTKQSIDGYYITRVHKKEVTEL